MKHSNEVIRAFHLACPDSVWKSIIPRFKKGDSDFQKISDYFFSLSCDKEEGIYTPSSDEAFASHLWDVLTSPQLW